MCKYCEGDNQNRKNLGDTNFNPIYIWSKYEKSYLLIDDGKTDLIDINYCPMCGRKLNITKQEEKWIECDDKLVRRGLDKDIFKLNCTARGNEGKIYAYRKNDWGQFEYCILEDHKYKWINDNGYCKFYSKEVIK